MLSHYWARCHTCSYEVSSEIEQDRTDLIDSHVAKVHGCGLYTYWTETGKGTVVLNKQKESPI